MRMRSSLVIAALSLALLPAATSAQNVDGLGGPLFGLSTARNGNLLVADASVGVIAIRRGKAGVVASLPGVTDVSAISGAAHWAVTGATGGAPGGLIDSGQGLHRVFRGQPNKLVNLFDFEAANNPDGGAIESNPFDVQSLGRSRALIADAAANALLRFTGDGVEVVAVFPLEVVSTASIKQLAGCPNPAPFCSLPPAIPAQPVPTSIAIAEDGFIYVGELKGFPAPTGESNIWRIAPHARGAQCGASADCVKVFDGGFTSIIDLAFGPDGRLYVAQFDEASWAAVEIFGTPLGGSIRSCSLESGVCEDVASGILHLTAITFGKDGSLWSTRSSLIPGEGQVVKVRAGDRSSERIDD